MCLYDPRERIGRRRTALDSDAIVRLIAIPQDVHAVVLRLLAERDVPDYYEVDHSKMTAKMTRIPLPSEVPYPVIMEPNLVIEFYSR